MTTWYIIILIVSSKKTKFKNKEIRTIFSKEYNVFKVVLAYLKNLHHILITLSLTSMT
jgi:hypothetical protein